MIRINLLPEDRRPVERTPLPRFLTILAGVLIFSIEGLVLVLLLTRFEDKRGERDEIRRKKQLRAADIGEIKALEAEILGFDRREGDVALIREKKRRLWAPILFRLTDSTVRPLNIWYSELEFKKGRGTGAAASELLSISGFSRNLNDREGRNTKPMVEAILDFQKNLTACLTKNKELLAEFNGEFGGTPRIKGRIKAGAIKQPRNPEDDVPKQALVFKLELEVKPKKAAALGGG